MTSTAIIGTTTWGATLGIILARNNVPVTILARTSREAEQLNADRENRRFLPGIPFPPLLSVDYDPQRVLARPPIWFCWPSLPSTSAATCNGSPAASRLRLRWSAPPRDWSFPTATG